MPVRARIVERQSEMGFVECGGLWLGYRVRHGLFAEVVEAQTARRDDNE